MKKKLFTLLVVIFIVMGGCAEKTDVPVTPLLKPPISYSSTVVKIDDYTYETIFTIHNKKYKVTITTDDLVSEMEIN